MTRQSVKIDEPFLLTFITVFQCDTSVRLV